MKNNIITGTQIQKNIGTGNNKFMTVQLDYVKPIANDGTIETGLRAQINELANENNNSIKYVGSEIYRPIPSASTNYTSINNVYAAYFSISGKANKTLSYKIGLRGEPDIESNRQHRGGRFVDQHVFGRCYAKFT